MVSSKNNNILEAASIYIVVNVLAECRISTCAWLALFEILAGLQRTLSIPSFAYVINRK